MRRKTLLTAVLCLALAAASQSVSGDLYKIGYVRAEASLEDSGETSSGAKMISEDGLESAPNAKTSAEDAAEGGSGGADVASEPTAPPETTAPAPEPTAPPETAAPEPTAPPETAAPEPTAPPETAAPEPTAPPETTAPETTPPETTAPETTAPETTPPETTAPETTAPETVPSETTPSETTAPETEETDAGQTEEAGGMAPNETAPTEAGLANVTDDLDDSDLMNGEFNLNYEPEFDLENGFLSNEALIARQKIVVPPDIEKEFRFTKVEKRYAIVKDRDGAQVYETRSTDAREVGTLNYYGCCYILEDQKDGWYYIESGNVRGFVEAEEVVVDEVADRIVKIKGLQELPSARLLVARTDNAAFAYTHTTVQEVMAKKSYALASEELKIYEQKKDSSRVIATMKADDLCYVLEDTDDTWVFVESGDARGFAEKKKLITGKKANKAVAKTGEQNMPLAEVLVKPEDNKACYYMITSVQEASQSARTREAMIRFAMQFLGNPYVWGGTSLTQGADCSGFVQSIYSYFGYSLPRVAEDQAQYGTQIPIESAEPGDLIFYARNGYVYHVSMYIGDGKVIHAAGRKVGIITSGIGGNAVWATRVIKD